MATATNILKSFDEQSVHIDYLCFTFAVKDLRHCHDAVRRLHKHEEYKGFAKSGLLQRHCRAPKFPAPPVFNRRSLRLPTRLMRTTKRLISVIAITWKTACASSPTKCLVCRCQHLVVWVSSSTPNP